MLGKHLEVTVWGRTLGRLGAQWGSRSPVLPYKFSRKHPASLVHHCVLFIKFTNERVSHLLEQCTPLPFAFSETLSLFIQTQEPGHPSSHSSKIAHGRHLWEQGEFGRTWALWATVQGSFIRTATSTVSFTQACSTRLPAYPDGHKGHFFLDINRCWSNKKGQ